MQRHQQVSHAPASRRAVSPGSETESPYGASWLTGAGDRDDIPATPIVSTRAVERRTGAGRSDQATHRTAPARGAVAAGS